MSVGRSAASSVAFAWRKEEVAGSELRFQFDQKLKLQETRNIGGFSPPTTVHTSRTHQHTLLPPSINLPSRAIITMADVAQSPVPLDTIPVSPEGGNAASDSTPSTNSGEVVTVFHDPENFNVKHPLAHTWTLWFTKPPSGKVLDQPASPCSHIVLTRLAARLE